ncbi:MAG: UDP-glucose--hexose-1-phosphate uridylyltransferase [Acidobacteriota bacterium]
MSSPDLNTNPHRRFNPLTREWILVSPQRAQRPWQGQVESVSPPASLSYDPACYLCPGNLRAGGVRNPAYHTTFVFGNDFAALRPDTPAWEAGEGGLLHAVSETGICRVVCFSPRHDLTLARMPVAEIERVVLTWTEQFRELGAQPLIHSVQIFENRGEMMGCSNPHPHGQIWASHSLPNELAKECASQSEYFAAHARTLLGDYLADEERRAERIVCANDHFVVLVPFWAVWPFETLLIGRRPATGLDELTREERAALAEILHQITVRYDNLFQTPFPYTMGFHQRPTDGAAHPSFHLHAHFYPPLLRSATVRKFMVGYELLAMPQRDITPEAAARYLREVPGRHYLATS